MILELTRRAHVFVLASFCAAMLLSACSSNPVSDAVSNVFGGKDESEGNAPEEDERISILALEEVLEADPRYSGMRLALPPPYRNSAWAQPGGEADHTLHHLTASLDFSVVWRTNIDAATGRRARLTSTPIAADGRLFVIDTRARVSAFSMETGKREWRSELTPRIKERFRVREILTRPNAAQIGFGGGVAYDAGRVFVTSGFGFVAALDAATGEEIWRIETEAPVRTPPTAYRGAVYVVTNTNELIAINQQTGEREWTFQSFEETARILSASSPAAAGDLVVAPFSSGELTAFLAGSGRLLWGETLARTTRLTALSMLNDIAGSPVIDRGLVYVVGNAGRLAAIDIRTGQRVWEVPVASLQMPWVAGDYIFLISVDAELICVSRDEGAIIWVSQLQRFQNEKKRKNRIAWAGPVLAGDHLILVSTRGEVVKVDAQDGAVIQTKRLGDSFSVSPIVAEETIYLLNDKGVLIALR